METFITWDFLWFLLQLVFLAIVTLLLLELLEWFFRKP